MEPPLLSLLVLRTGYGHKLLWCRPCFHRYIKTPTSEIDWSLRLGPFELRRWAN